MGLKILHSADWHLGSPFGSLPEAVRQRMRAHQRELPGRIAELCIREGCDLVLLAGDIFDAEPDWETVDFLKEALARCGVPVLIAPGNHDYVRPGSPWTDESWPENVVVFTEGLSYLDIPELNCRVYGAGYQSMDCEALLDGFRAEGDGYRIGLLHGDPTNASSPNCPITAAAVRDSGLHYLALGHIHRSGAFRAGGTLCAWPGCPMGRGWDETEDKGVLLVTLEETAEIRAVSLGMPRFFDITVTVDGDAEAALDAALPPAATEDLYRVTLRGTGKPDCGALLARYAHLGYLELRDQTEAPVDLWENAGEDSLRGVYFRLLREQLEAADPEAQKIIRLAAQLSRKLLDGKEVELP